MKRRMLGRKACLLSTLSLSIFLMTEASSNSWWPDGMPFDSNLDVREYQRIEKMLFPGVEKMLDSLRSELGSLKEQLKNTNARISSLESEWSEINGRLRELEKILPSNGRIPGPMEPGYREAYIALVEQVKLKERSSQVYRELSDERKIRENLQAEINPKERYYIYYNDLFEKYKKLKPKYEELKKEYQKYEEESKKKAEADKAEQAAFDSYLDKQHKVIALKEQQAGINKNITDSEKSLPVTILKYQENDTNELIKQIGEKQSEISNNEVEIKDNIVTKPKYSAFLKGENDRLNKEIKDIESQLTESKKNLEMLEQDSEVKKYRDLQEQMKILKEQEDKIMAELNQPSGKSAAARNLEPQLYAEEAPATASSQLTNMNGDGADSNILHNPTDCEKNIQATTAEIETLQNENSKLENKIAQEKVCNTKTKELSAELNELENKNKELTHKLRALKQ